MKIGVVTFPISKASIIPASNLAGIMQSLSGEVYLITGNEGSILSKKNDGIHTYIIRHESGMNLFTRILKYICTQSKMSYFMMKISGYVDMWLFFIGGEGLLLPMLTALLLRKKVVLLLVGFPTRGYQVQKEVFSKAMSFLSNINLALSNRIVVYSERTIQERSLEKYRNKICIAPRHFLDFDKFKIKKRFGERSNLVGYIGRLSEEKGVLNFVKAIPEILKERNEIRFLIGGEGQLRDKIEENSNKGNLNNKVKLAGWIQHDELPDHLNELKLVVLPSYTEGLPNIMLEAMACGTPVLATPVGAIPDVIKDEETGFILENNSPECIAKNVERALNHPNLEEIVKTARKLVEKEFTYEATVERYKAILSSLVNIK